MFRTRTKGFGLIEVVIGSAIITIGILGVITGFTTYVRYALSNERNIQAAYLLEEGVEAVTFLRDKGWTTYITPLTASTTYYLAYNGSYWTATTTKQYVEEFVRSFVITAVTRDANDKIAASGTNDPNTKKVTVTLQYHQGSSTTTKSISTYITNMYEN